MCLCDVHHSSSTKHKQQKCHLGNDMNFCSIINRHHWPPCRTGAGAGFQLNDPDPQLKKSRLPIKRPGCKLKIQAPLKFRAPN